MLLLMKVTNVKTKFWCNEIKRLTYLTVDSYDGHEWLYLGFTIAYGIGLIGVGFIGSVIWYELSGGTGQYRTLTNQLVSWTLIEVCE